MEGELRWAAARLIQDFGLTGELTEQVIEGKPEESFAGRLSIVVTGQTEDTSAAMSFLSTETHAGHVFKALA